MVGGELAGIADFARARAAMLRRFAEHRAARFGRRSYAPDMDDPDMIMEWEGGYEVPPIAFHIVYSDRSSRLSGRCITTRRIQGEVNDVRVVCFCHKRERLRTFLASRMVELFDLACGEVFDDALAYFRHHPLFKPMTGDVVAALSPATRAVQKCRDEIILLTFIAAADGTLGDADEDQIVKHVLDRVPDDDVVQTEVRARIREFVPDEGAFGRALGRLCGGEGDAEALIRSMRRIIDANGRMDLQEMAFADAIESKLREAARL